MASEIEKGALEQVAPEVEGSVAYNIDPEEDRRVLRKIDWVVMPTMMIVLFFQCKIFIDYSNLPTRSHKD